MNKVIAALDGLNISESTVDFAAYLAKHFNAHIVATFLEDITYHQPRQEHKHLFTEWSEVEKIGEEEEAVRKTALHKIQSRFNNEGIKYNIHEDKIIAIQSLLNESYYADMVVIGAHEKFSNWDKSEPSHFIKELLAGTDCPVILVPNVFTPIQKIIFCYDGSPASIYAIKQFGYLFTVLPDQQIEILMVTENKHSNHFPNQQYLKELLKQKYSVVLQSVIKDSDTQKGIVEYLQTQGSNCMIVLGAYQRSTFSRWLNQSIADKLISTLNVPIFIAHK